MVPAIIQHRQCFALLFSVITGIYAQVSQSAQEIRSQKKVVALRALAWFYFYPGPLRDFQKGREYFEKARQVLKNPTDAYSTFTLGYTHEQWGLVEISNGFAMEGQSQIARARKYYSDLPGNFPLRKQALELLDSKVNLAAQQTAISYTNEGSTDVR